MEQPQYTQVKNAMNYGAVLGIALIIISLLFYMMGESTSKIQQYIGFVVIILGIFVGTKNYRDAVLGGYMSYGGCLGMGTLIAFFSAIIVTFYSYIFFTFIDASLIDVIMDQVEGDMIDSGRSEDEIELAMEYTRKFMTPFWMTVISLMSYTFWGFVFSLITSIFLKNENKSFESNFQ